LGLALILKNKKKREKWAKDWLLKRKTYSHVNLLNELRFEPLDFKNYLRMDEDTYRNLLSMVVPLIQKQDTVMRKSTLQLFYLKHLEKLVQRPMMLCTEYYVGNI